ncbi:armadillo-type protein [Phakopsora pachyrhizi]|nr:armadillo-type protein [Phakopsora pachyrhizi]
MRANIVYTLTKNEEIQCHAILILRNQAASSEKNKEAIVKAGAIERIKELLLSMPLRIHSEMTACAAVLGLSKDIKGQLLDLGILEVLIPLTNSISVEVQGNSLAEIENLSSKFKEIFFIKKICWDDYSAFSMVWDSPEWGFKGYLIRLLESSNPRFQHIAVWTCIQLLDSGELTLENNIRGSQTILLLVQHDGKHCLHLD